MEKLVETSDAGSSASKAKPWDSPRIETLGPLSRFVKGIGKSGTRFDLDQQDRRRTPAP